MSLDEMSELFDVLVKEGVSKRESMLRSVIRIIKQKNDYIKNLEAKVKELEQENYDLKNPNEAVL